MAGSKRAGLGVFERSFWRLLLPLALPIALQNLLTTSFRLVDTLMIGPLGDVSIAAVGLAGQASFLVELVLFGMVSGSAVFTAQYHGAGNLDGIRRTLGATLLFGVPFGLLATLVCFFFPTQVMALLTDDAALIAEGTRYLTYACWSYLPLSVYQALCTTLRSTEQVRLPVMGSAVCAVANGVLNYVFIFGVGPIAPMGVAGAGLATAITAALNPLLIVLVSLRERNILIAPWKKLLDLGGFLGLYWRRVLPVLCNELLWSLSIVLLNMILGRMGTENYAALTVVRTVENVVYVFFVGVCSACNVLIGKRIGEGDEAAARLYARRFLVLIPLLGAAFGLLRGRAARAGAQPVRHVRRGARHGHGHDARVRGGRGHPQRAVPVRGGHLPRGRGHALRAHRRRGGQLRPRAAGGAAVQQHPGLFVPADVHHHARGGRRGQARVLPAAHLLHEVDSPRGGPARGGAAAGGRVTPPRAAV